MTTGAPRGVPAVVDLAAYRIVQESLTNAVRYAGPASVQVTVCYRPDELVVEVSDDGPGPVDAATIEGGGGHGIRGMRERTTAVGGTLSVGGRAEGGFAVRACVPLASTLR